MTLPAWVEAAGDVPPGPGSAPVLLDAFTGDTVVGGPWAASYRSWALQAPAVQVDKTLLPSPPRPENWQDPRVGWGVVLPERPGLDAAALARADDAGEAIRALVASRPDGRTAGCSAIGRAARTGAGRCATTPPAPSHWSPPPR